MGVQFFNFYVGFKQPEPVNITYKYQSHSSTTNNVRSGYPPETEPLLPQKFPREPEIGGPPKGVDELMATIGGEVSKEKRWFYCFFFRNFK